MEEISLCITLELSSLPLLFYGYSVTPQQMNTRTEDRTNDLSQILDIFIPDEGTSDESHNQNKLVALSPEWENTVSCPNRTTIYLLKVEEDDVLAFMKSLFFRKQLDKIFQHKDTYQSRIVVLLHTPNNTHLLWPLFWSCGGVSGDSGYDYRLHSWLTLHLPGNTTLTHIKMPRISTCLCEIVLTFTQKKMKFSFRWIF